MCISQCPEPGHGSSHRQRGFAGVITLRFHRQEDCQGYVGGLCYHNSPRRERAASKEKPVGAVRDLKVQPVGDSKAEGLHTQQEGPRPGKGKGPFASVQQP